MTLELTELGERAMSESSAPRGMSWMETSLLHSGTVADADITLEEHRASWKHRFENSEVLKLDREDPLKAQLRRGEIEQEGEEYYRWLTSYADVLPRYYVDAEIGELMGMLEETGHTTEYEFKIRMPDGERLSTRFLDAMITHPDIRVAAHAAIFHQLDDGQQVVFLDRSQGAEEYIELIDRASRAIDARNRMTEPKRVRKPLASQPA
jgi:hypothetical protein